ncbi:MAG TPA: hypothetical protein PKY77_18445 [Phycisphaerae bacterium]|nr:hypothetical protein [Phycisphaerae bacterium]HRY70889.1 hypothetical protein [Phycisphaerae bacterium]HSA30108.1 hypothetical protein [Phycisphaerae bacterium]
MKKKMNLVLLSKAELKGVLGSRAGVLGSCAPTFPFPPKDPLPGGPIQTGGNSTSYTCQCRTETDGEHNYDVHWE